jgi:hypothetical protein
MIELTGKKVEYMDNKEIPKIIDFDALKRGKTSREVCQCGLEAKYVIDEEKHGC